jgi:hypothetical protein
VNDPSTAISCTDELSRIVFNPPQVPQVIPWIGQEGMLDLTFEQIRHNAPLDRLQDDEGGGAGEKTLGISTSV